MWIWILCGGAALCCGALWLARRRADPDQDVQEFLTVFSEEIRQCGRDYEVCGVVPGTMTMIVRVRGQEVPVPIDNLFRHYQLYPEQVMSLARQLLSEIEEIGLERPQDRMFADAAMQILPQVCTKDWVFASAPAFGGAALVHRELGPDLVLCYVIDDPWSMVFVCNAHLGHWGRTEPDLFHLANQNLRRLTTHEIRIPGQGHGPVRLRSGDGYDAARVLLLDPECAADLLIAMPERDELCLGRTEDLESMASLMRVDDPSREHPVSAELYRLEDQQLVPVSEPDLGWVDPLRS